MTRNSDMDGDPEQVTVIASASDAGIRLDKFLATRLDGLTRTRVQTLIRSGLVVAAGKPVADIGRRIKTGEEYVVALPPPETASPVPQAIPLTVVFEDRHLIVIDKPAGLVVHPAAGHASGTLVNALLAHCGDSLSGIGGVKRPGIVHRLDKETSGLLVVAKTDAAHQGLAGQFAAHGSDGRLVRTYLAIVWGVPSPKVGTIDARLARSQTNRTRVAVTRGSAGRHAVTHYEVLEIYTGERTGEPVASLVRARLETGRTHQIRVHFAHIGHPVLGDPVYGAGFKASASKLGPEAREALASLGRQALHAAELGFEHPETGRPLQFASDLPADLAALKTALAPERETASGPPKRARRSVRS